MTARRPLTLVRFRLLVLLGTLACWSLPVTAQTDQRLGTTIRAATPEQPLEVHIGVSVDQITGIDQKAENFGVVANLRLEWTDPALAFDAREHGRGFKQYTLPAFTRYVDEHAILAPGFVIYNQQGRRFSQEQSVTVFADGHALYLERFTATLQAPDFDFVQYPLDSQKFFVHVDSVWPTTYVGFKLMADYSRLGDRLGEEEWIFEEIWTKISEAAGIADEPTARFTLGFVGHRHLDYYILRIFIPLILIILVSWVTFFLQDFGKRIDVGAGNLLVFVAFNFTVSNDLPRLGYMTFMDAILVMTFVVTALVVVINVMFRRMEVTGREALARRLDNYTIGGYPLGLAVLVLICWYLYEFKPAQG